MAEVVAELERRVRAEPQPAKGAHAAQALLAGIVVAQLAWVTGLLLVVVALIR